MEIFYTRNAHLYAAKNERCGLPRVDFSLSLSHKQNVQLRARDTREKCKEKKGEMCCAVENKKNKNI